MAGTDQGNKAPQPRTARIWDATIVMTAHASGAMYPWPALAKNAVPACNTIVRITPSAIAARASTAPPVDQLGKPIATPIPRASTNTQAPTPHAIVATTIALANTTVRRDVGMAKRFRKVRSAYSRPKTHAVRKANRIAPPTVMACPSMDQ